MNTGISHVQKIQTILQNLGYSFDIKEFSELTRTSQEAASAIGCQLGQIAKSLIFKGNNSNQPILVIASGKNRVNVEAVSHLVGEPIGKADADFVYATTGFTIGGIPPLGHSQPIRTILDQDLFSYEEIWAAAGSPHAVFKLTPDELQDITHGSVASVSE